MEPQNSILDSSYLIYLTGLKQDFNVFIIYLDSIPILKYLDHDICALISSPSVKQFAVYPKLQCTPNAKGCAGLFAN